TVILDGVVPIGEPVGLSSPMDAEAAPERILRPCALDAVCHARFGDPAAHYRAVRATLKLNTVPVRARDSTSRDAAPFEFGSHHLATVLRLLSNTQDYAALLPLLLHAGARDDYAQLASQCLMVERSYAQPVATGMHNSVVCAEDVPLFAGYPIERA